MNKLELVNNIAETAGLTKGQAGKALDAMVSSITAALGTGEEVVLVGFGSFYISEREARAGRNPRTGETIHIPAAKQVKFRPGKSLKDSVQ